MKYHFQLSLCIYPSISLWPSLKHSLSLAVSFFLPFAYLQIKKTFALFIGLVLWARIYSKGDIAGNPRRAITACAWGNSIHLIWPSNMYSSKKPHIFMIFIWPKWIVEKWAQTYFFSNARLEFGTHQFIIQFCDLYSSVYKTTQFCLLNKRPEVSQTDQSHRRIYL